MLLTKAKSASITYANSESSVLIIKPQRNGRNIAGNQLPTLLGARYMMRSFAQRVIAESLKLVKRLSQRLPTFLLIRDRQSVAQQYWIRLHSTSDVVRVTHTHNTETSWR